MNPALAQLKQLADLGMRSVATKEELEVFLKAILKVLKELKDKSDANTQTLFVLFNKIKQEMTDKMESESKMLKEMHGNVSGMLKETELKVATVPDIPAIIADIKNQVSQLKILTLEDVGKDLPKYGFAFRNELVELEKKIDERINSLPKGSKGGFGGSKNATKFYDLSSQANGTLKTFTVPKNVAAIVLCSDFPTVLMEGRGFTLNNYRTYLTLTVDNAPSKGCQLLFQYSSVFN